MKSMLAKTSGYKTYFVAIVSVLWAGYGVWSGFISYEMGSIMVQTALLGSGLRSAISKK